MRALFVVDGPGADDIRQRINRGRLIDTYGPVPGTRAGSTRRGERWVSIFEADTNDTRTDDLLRESDVRGVAIYRDEAEARSVAKTIEGGVSEHR